MKITLKNEAGEVFEKDFKSTQVSIGRSNRSDFVVTNDSLSRQHCLVELVEGEFFVTDLASSNGVFIDGNKIAPNQRTLFKSFNALSIGALECIIEDVSDVPETLHYKEVKNAEVVGPQNKTKMIKRPEAKPEASKIQLLIVPLAILGFAVYYFANSEREIEKTVINSTETESKPAYKSQVGLFKDMPNIFKSASEYQSEESQKSCIGEFERYCLKMKLNTAREGFIKSNKNLTLYIEPSLHEKELRYRGVEKLSDKYDLIVMDKVLASDPMTEVFLNNSLHFHVVVKDLNGAAKKVFRFHPASYSTAHTNRLDALRLLEVSLQSANTQNFWAHLNKHISVIELPTP